MFKTLALLSALTSVAFAQNATAKANPLIPSGISPSCTAFLTDLDKDTALAGCLSSLNTATSAFAPGSTATVSQATVTGALGNLCSDSVANACPENVIRTKITNFYTACTAELTTNKVAEIIRTYDTLYTIPPMRTAICSKDDSGSWCVLASPGKVAKEGGSVSVQDILKDLFTSGTGALRRRADAIVPNMGSFSKDNLPFLYYTPGLDSATLCTSCLRQILTAYINFESNVAYAPGLANSQLLSTQSSLLDSVKSKCPAGFLNGAVQAAGGLSGGLFSNTGAATMVTPEHAIAVLMGGASLAASYMF